MKKIYHTLSTASTMGLFSKKMSKEEKEVQKFQKELNAEYLNPKETPLRGDNFKILKTSFLSF